VKRLDGSLAVKPLAIRAASGTGPRGICRRFATSARGVPAACTRRASGSRGGDFFGVNPAPVGIRWPLYAQRYAGASGLVRPWVRSLSGN
jgi:hypothetical protein